MTMCIYSFSIWHILKASAEILIKIVAFFEKISSLESLTSKSKLSFYEPTSTLNGIT